MAKKYPLFYSVDESTLEKVWREGEDLCMNIDCLWMPEDETNTAGKYTVNCCLVLKNARLLAPGEACFKEELRPGPQRLEELERYAAQRGMPLYLPAAAFETGSGVTVEEFWLDQEAKTFTVEGYADRNPIPAVWCTLRYSFDDLLLTWGEEDPAEAEEYQETEETE